MSEPVTVALSKGKLLAPTLELFRRAGYQGIELCRDERRFVFDVPQAGLTFLIVRPSDVPTYVEYGAADVGVAGKDLLLEQQADIYEPLDLRIGACRIVVAMLRRHDPARRLSSKIRVATKYPNITEQYFTQQGIPVEIIKLYGSIELAPIVGLADRIVDLVSSGRTLKAHNLQETETIAWSTARLIVNRASLKMKHAVITTMIQRLRRSRPRTPQ
ncbi:MAG: ATP phosphoribosyltransferase [Nitrospirae bacterium]|nr:MAG: ATP phosphoribosyltransferase [Nitrospirota bacterium]